MREHWCVGFGFHKQSVSIAFAHTHCWHSKNVAYIFEACVGMLFVYVYSMYSVMYVCVCVCVFD